MTTVSEIDLDPFAANDAAWDRQRRDADHKHTTNGEYVMQS